jgi:3-hydroxyisobutyrate dehydrogenase-like beta-hydroxyacid dehydrogenase
METIGILHPGEMGISLAASARRGGSAVHWVSEGRSEKTRLRAMGQELLDTGSMAALCRTCSVIISICPPHAAEEMAGRVAAQGFRGLYLDANAISPQRALRISEAMQAAGISFVDGGIIGGPAWQAGETWLYISGPEAARIAACFQEGPLETRIIGTDPGKASALKMCYAAYSKGTTALLIAVLAAAESLGVDGELAGQWERDEPGFSDRAARRAARAALKAWRFEGEMYEIADTLRSAGLPDGFHQAAAEIYRRLSGFKGAAEPPEYEHVIRSLIAEG